jgi:predicted nicotinamide N-methyase
MQHPHSVQASEGTPDPPSTSTTTTTQAATVGAGSGSSQLADQGAQLAAEGRFEQAAACFEQAVKEDPSDAAVLEMLAQCRMEGAQDEAAFEAAAAAARLRPDWPPALLTLGRAARNAGRLRDAAAAYRSYQQVASAAAAAAPVAAGCGAQEAAEAAQEEAQEAAAARDELAEVLLLLQRQLGHQLGLPGLVLLERHGAEDGPAAVVWEAGALLAWFLVQQQQQQQQSATAICGSTAAGGGAGSGHLHCGAGCSVGASAASAAPPITCSSKAATGGSGGFWSSMRVLELGAGGTGIVGLAAACLGAAVTATDLPEVLPQLQASVAANGGMLAAAGGSIAVAALDWRQPDLAILQPDQPFDYLLGADLVYSAAAVGPLVAAIKNARRSSSSPLKILICHKHRHQDVDAALLAALAAAGVPLRAVLRDASRCTVYANGAACEALSLI